MLDVKFLRENTELVRRKMLERGQEIDFSPFINSEKRRRDILQEVEALRGERNKASKEIGTLKKEKKDASELVTKMAFISDRIKALDAELAQAEADIQSFIMVIPNIQHESVEYGTSSEENVVVRTWGEKPVMDFEPKPHWDIGEN
ncbi:MAG TPA: serine--tRNA ligase, partial [Syntrophales bacterium]